MTVTKSKTNDTGKDMLEEKTATGRIASQDLQFYVRLQVSHLLVFLAGWGYISRRLSMKNYPAYPELIQMKRY